MRFRGKGSLRGNEVTLSLTPILPRESRDTGVSKDYVEKEAWEKRRVDISCRAASRGGRGCLTLEINIVHESLKVKQEAARMRLKSLPISKYIITRCESI